MPLDAESKPNNFERSTARSYLWEFLAGIASYVVVIVAVVTWGNLGGSNPIRFLWAVLPALPVVWMIIAFARHIRRADELQRTTLLTALAWAFAAAMLTAVVVGMLGIAGLVLALGFPWIILMVGMITFGLAAGILASR